MEVRLNSGPLWVSDLYWLHTISGCSSGWSKFRDHCYKVDKVRRPWKHSLEFCEKQQVKKLKCSSVLLCIIIANKVKHLRLNLFPFILMKKINLLLVLVFLTFGLLHQIYYHLFARDRKSLVSFM